MQELTYLVAIEDLPSEWPWEEVCSSATDVAEGCTSPDVDANTMHLPCGHVFSPSALDANTSSIWPRLQPKRPGLAFPHPRHAVSDLPRGVRDAHGHLKRPLVDQTHICQKNRGPRGP